MVCYIRKYVLILGDIPADVPPTIYDVRLRSPTCRQSAFKRCHSDEHFSEFLPTRWRQKSTGIDMEQNDVTVGLCMRYAAEFCARLRVCLHVLFELYGTKRDVPKVIINNTVGLLFQTTIRSTEDWTFANDLRLFDKSLLKNVKIHVFF